ncbi:MAG: hypothetical protein ACK4K9_06245 [Bacteroidia bacterium]
MIHALLLLHLLDFEDKTIKEINQIELELSQLKQQIKVLELRKKELNISLEEYKSTHKPEFKVKKIISKNKKIADYYQATGWMVSGGKKTRVIVHVGTCKKFKGDENSKEVQELAEKKIKAAINKKSFYNI